MGKLTRRELLLDLGIVLVIGAMWWFGVLFPS